MRRGRPPAPKAPVLSSVTVAIHTHLVIRARLNQAKAEAERRAAMADAVKAGISARVLARAIRIMTASPADRALEEKARALVALVESVPVGAITMDDPPGAFPPPAPSRNLLSPPSEA